MIAETRWLSDGHAQRQRPETDTEIKNTNNQSALEAGHRLFGEAHRGCLPRVPPPQS